MRRKSVRATKSFPAALQHSLHTSMPGFPFFFQSTLSGLIGAVKSRTLYSPSPFSKDWQLDFPQANPLCLGKHCGKACRLSNFQASRILNACRSEEIKRERDSTGNITMQSSGDDAEHDLDAMVQDFIENGSSDQKTFHSKGYNEDVKIVELNDSLQALISSVSLQERDLHWAVTSMVLSLSETDIDIFGHGAAGTNCNGTCIRRRLVKHLKLQGHDAALCKGKWHNIGGVPGGEYEYIGITLSDVCDDRIIIDIDFQSQFAIARPVPRYEAALRLIPLIFIGKSSRLEQVLELMSEAGKSSLKQSSMHLPPWRTLEYMRAKWFSPYKRITGNCFDEDPAILHKPDPDRRTSANNQCREQLMHMQAYLKRAMTPKSISDGTKTFPSMLTN